MFKAFFVFTYLKTNAMAAIGKIKKPKRASFSFITTI